MKPDKTMREGRAGQGKDWSKMIIIVRNRDGKF